MLNLQQRCYGVTFFNYIVKVDLEPSRKQFVRPFS